MLAAMGYMVSRLLLRHMLETSSLFHYKEVSVAENELQLTVFLHNCGFLAVVAHAGIDG